MEYVDKIVIGLALFVFTSILAYLFKMRQLYVVTPKLFRHASISKDGSLCEVIIYNRGNQVEEAIKVEIDPALRAELLASATSELTLSGSTIHLERLHKGSEASAILLVENGALDTSKLVSITSKETNGSIRKSIVEVPPNFAKVFLVFVAFISFFPAMIYFPRVYDSLYTQYAEYRLRNAPIAGWQGLSEYFSSDLSESYSTQEFPVFYKGIVKEGGRNHYKFGVFNKTAIPLIVYVDMKNSQGIGSPYFASVTVPPMSKSDLLSSIPSPDSSRGQVILDISFKWGTEFIYKMFFTIPESEETVKRLDT